MVEMPYDETLKNYALDSDDPFLKNVTSWVQRLTRAEELTTTAGGCERLGRLEVVVEMKTDCEETTLTTRVLDRSAEYFGSGRRDRELRSWARLSANEAGTKVVVGTADISNLPVRYSSCPWYSP